MRVALQRVSRAEVRIRADGESRVSGRIGRGLVALVGFTDGDTDAQVEWMADKVLGLRILRTHWVNLDRVWAVAFVVAGLGVALAWWRG